MLCTFPTHNITLFSFPDFKIIYYLTNRTQWGIGSITFQLISVYLNIILQMTCKKYFIFNYLIKEVNLLLGVLYALVWVKNILWTFHFGQSVSHIFPMKYTTHSIFFWILLGWWQNIIFCRVVDLLCPWALLLLWNYFPIGSQKFNLSYFIEVLTCI